MAQNHRPVRCFGCSGTRCALGGGHVRPQSDSHPHFKCGRLQPFCWSYCSASSECHGAAMRFKPTLESKPYFAPCPFSAFPAIAPVAFPFSNATCPFTITYFTPSANCAG